eukprot:UN14167
MPKLRTFLSPYVLEVGGPDALSSKDHESREGGASSSNIVSEFKWKRSKHSLRSQSPQSSVTCSVGFGYYFIRQFHIC